MSIKEICCNVLNLPCGRINLVPIASAAPVFDQTLKYIIYDDCRNNLAFALVSPRNSADSVYLAMEKAYQARDYLGATKLGQVILSPISAGYADGLSFAILPYCHPISTNKIRKTVQRSFIRKPLLHWLLAVAEYSVATPGEDSLKERFKVPLEILHSLRSLSAETRGKIAQSINNIDKKEWKPKTVLMHGDLWQGNILLKPERHLNHFSYHLSDLVIIDWPTMQIEGYGFFDLLRYAIDEKLSRVEFHSALQRYCSLLQCDQRDVFSYVATAHGWILMHLGHFPMDRFLCMFEHCEKYLLRQEN